MAQLKRDEILDAAVELLDQGPGALTMRSLADRLGVTGAALYYWFPAKADLMDAIAEHVAALIIATGSPTAPWKDRLRAIALSISDAAQVHPVTFNWVFMNYGSRPPLAQIDEAMLDVLLSAGFTPPEALLAKGAVLRLVVGDLGLARIPVHIDPGAADPGAYPRVQEVAADSAALGLRDYLEYGLDRVIDGIDSSRRRRARTRAASRDA